jgi:hypothetical protein
MSIKDIYPDIANHVIAQGMKWQGAWQEGKTPNLPEKSLFKKVLRLELQLDFGGIDINETDFKGKAEDLWEGPGQDILSAILEALGGAGARQRVGEKTKPTKAIQTAAAKLLKKCAMFTEEKIAVAVKEEDSSRVLVTNSFRDYDTLRGTILCIALNNILSGHETPLNDITTSDIMTGVMNGVCHGGARKFS